MTKIDVYNPLARQLDMKGFVILRRRLGDELLSHYRRLISPTVYCNDPPGKFHFMQRDPDGFTTILADPTITGLVRFFCGQHARLDNYFGFCYPGRGVSANVHGGPFSENRSVYYTSQGGVYQTSNLKVGIPLQDQQGTLFVPGSHRTDFPAQGRLTAERELVNPPLKHGDVVIFTDALVHGTAHVERPRQMLYYTFTPGHVAWAVYEEPTWLLQVPEPRRRFFRAPGMVKIDPSDRTNNQAISPTF